MLWINTTITLTYEYGFDDPQSVNRQSFTDGLGEVPDLPEGTVLLRTLAACNGVTAIQHGTAAEPGSYTYFPGMPGAAQWYVYMPTALPDEATGEDLNSTPLLTGAISPYYSINDVFDDIGDLYTVQSWGHGSVPLSGAGRRRTSGWTGADPLQPVEANILWSTGNGSDFFNGPVTFMIRTLWDLST